MTPSMSEPRKVAPEQTNQLSEPDCLAQMLCCSSSSSSPSDSVSAVVVPESVSEELAAESSGWFPALSVLLSVVVSELVSELVSGVMELESFSKIGTAETGVVMKPAKTVAKTKVSARQMDEKRCLILFIIDIPIMTQKGFCLNYSTHKLYSQE